MGMENLLNYYFIMKKRFVTVLLACSLAGGLFAQQPWFKDKDLTLTGAYYYPEHWDESQWERDFKQMHDLGFEFTHFAVICLGAIGTGRRKICIFLVG